VRPSLKQLEIEYLGREKSAIEQSKPKKKKKLEKAIMKDIEKVAQLLHELFVDHGAQLAPTTMTKGKWLRS